MAAQPGCSPLLNISANAVRILGSFGLLAWELSYIEKSAAARTRGRQGHCHRRNSPDGAVGKVAVEACPAPSGGPASGGWGVRSANKHRRNKCAVTK